MSPLPGPHEVLARGLENDTAVEIHVTRDLRAAVVETQTLLHTFKVRLADGVVTPAEATDTLSELETLLTNLEVALCGAEISLQYNRVHNAVMAALRAGLDPRSPEALLRFPLLRSLDLREGSFVRQEPERIVA